MGNICRSPTAEGVMRALVADAGLDAVVDIDSAGTGGWHVGDPPDARAVAAAARRGIVLDGAARKVTRADFHGFDLLLAADAANVRDLLALAPDDAGAEKVRLLREFDPVSAARGELDLPRAARRGPLPCRRRLTPGRRRCAPRWPARSMPRSRRCARSSAAT
jgi:protein-tyrosine phosphatase